MNEKENKWIKESSRESKKNEGKSKEQLVEKEIKKYQREMRKVR